MKDQQLQFIRQKCIEANPDGFEFGVPRLIRFADIILAIGEFVPKMTALGHTHVSADKIHLMLNLWNLKQDDLTIQSPECIEFIFNLLK